ncbi:MAG: helix-turn-helix transcriptional regulator [Ilumatobacteraceae bacterium]
MTDGPRHQLGEFLRSRRQRLQPRHVGLPDGSRRRTSGLRREEVAELANISTDWYTRIEQGRPVTPSPETLDALARALRLNEAEHAHLRALAADAPHAATADRCAGTDVPPDVRRVVHSMTQPAYVTGPRWDVLAWNQAADQLFGFSRVPVADRNTLILMFTGESSRKLFGDRWAAEARRMVAQFHATCDLMAGDPTLRDFVRRLTSESADFAEWWEAHEIREIGPGTKWLNRSDGTTIGFGYTTFHPTEDPTLKLVVYNQVPGEADQ